MLSFSNTSQLLTAAEAYFYLGYSVIPLLGDRDPARPKVPAIPWAGYQQYHATLQEQEQWFTQERFAGLGVVTGRVSGLVVLDFDSHNVMQDFRARFPDLMETHTILSANRQLPHLYFKLPPYLYIESTKGQGFDLLSDGRYVVAPPTSINGQAYKINRGGQPKVLQNRDIQRLQAFFSTHRIDSSLKVHSASKNPSRTVLTPSEPLNLKPSAQDLSRLYRYHCQHSGRNEALFRTSLYARDSGWLSHEVHNVMTPLHSQQATLNAHSPETPAQRQREALNTIRSAFSKPARPLQKHISHREGVLSNSVREALMQRGMTYFVRTYEGLLLKGVHPGQVVTAKESVENLKGLVGRDSVLKALQAGEGNQRFFGLPGDPSQTANAVARDTTQLNNKKCFLLSEKNQYKPQGGRPEHRYRMPSNEELCHMLGVKPCGSDVLEAADLSSASKTRMALHRELIKRRPGKYTRRWLAARLGVTKPTINTYNRLIPIHSRPTYTETSIRWSNIALLPFDEPLQGAFLVTLKGKKYPALRTIASMLLARGEGISLQERQGNFYWYGDEEPPINLLNDHHDQLCVKSQAVKIPLTKIPVAVPKIPIQAKTQSATKQSRAINNRLILRQNFHKPLKDVGKERFVQRLYEMLNTEENKHFSLANARKITVTYTEQEILDAFDCLKNRSYVTNPIGFFITVLRSFNKLKQFSNLYFS